MYTCVLRDGDGLVETKLDRLGLYLSHLAGTVQGLPECGISLRMLAGLGAQIDTTIGGGPIVLGILAVPAEFESRERKVA